jgi:predicted  nucleic acid-binding Zn-ribbon protein
VKIEATAADIRALLELARVDLDARQAASGTRKKGQEAAARDVPSPLLDRYQSLLDAGRTPAVVAIERGACSGCHMRLPTMLEYKACRSTAIHMCPHCRRMLYAPEPVQADSHAQDGKPSRRATAPSAPRRSR